LKGFARQARMARVPRVPQFNRPTLGCVLEK
jgi:hypothetical protein